jgi:hypothetical protein
MPSSSENHVSNVLVVIGGLIAGMITIGGVIVYVVTANVSINDRLSHVECALAAQGMISTPTVCTLADRSRTP